LENTEETIKNGQKHNTFSVRHHYEQTNTNNVNRTWVLLQTTGGKCKQHRFYAEIVMDITTWNAECKYT